MCCGGAGQRDGSVCRSRPTATSSRGKQIISIPARKSKSREIRELLKEGNRLRMIPLTFISRPGGDGFRAVVIGRQVKGAVRRNRIRRRIRELLRLHPAWFAGDLDLVIRAGEGSERMDFRNLGEKLEKAGKIIARENRRDG